MFGSLIVFYCKLKKGCFSVTGELKLNKDLNHARPGFNRALIGACNHEKYFRRGIAA